MFRPDEASARQNLGRQRNRGGGEETRQTPAARQKYPNEDYEQADQAPNIPASPASRGSPAASRHWENIGKSRRAHPQSMSDNSVRIGVVRDAPLTDRYCPDRRRSSR